MLRKDGRHIMVEFSASPILNASGEPQAILGIGRDVTQRKIAEWLMRKAKNTLEQRTEQLQASQTQLRKLAGQVITIHEEERRIIAQELHDDAGQTLITLKHSLSSALDELPEQPGALRDRLVGSLKLVDRSMTLIRSVSHRLRPPALEAGGLNLSLAELCRECREGTRLQIHYEGQELPGLPVDIAINLYRVAQEAITNILKHAAATRVRIALTYKRGKISLSILDNGVGSPVDIQDHAGIGLFGMQERLGMLGGELNVDVKQGHGYRLTARVPWKASQTKNLL
jgi:signal transduction histidine kinase